MIQIEVEVGQQRYTSIEQAFAKLGDKLEHSLDQAGPLLSTALRDALQLVAQEIAKKHGNPWGGGVVNQTPFLQQRTGQGLKSIKESIVAKAQRGEELVAGSISAGKLSIHETGGVIRAKSAQYLTIPLPAAMDPRGVPLRQRARDWDHTFVARSKKGTLLIFRKLPGPNQITPLYILKPSVRIPARLNMEATISNTGLPYFEQRALDQIAKLLDEV